MNPELEAICNQTEEQAKDWLRNSREAHRGFPGGDMLKISETLAKTFGTTVASELQQIVKDRLDWECPDYEAGMNHAKGTYPAIREGTFDAKGKKKGEVTMHKYTAEAEEWLENICSSKEGQFADAASGNATSRRTFTFLGPPDLPPTPIAEEVTQFLALTQVDIDLIEVEMTLDGFLVNANNVFRHWLRHWLVVEKSTKIRKSDNSDFCKN